MTKFRNGDRVMHRDHDWAVTVIADGPGPNGWIPVVNDDGNFNCLAAGFLSLVPLADPAPVGLTEAAAPTPLSDAERTVMEGVMRGDSTRITHTEALLALALHRLSAAPVDNREREGEVLLHGERWRVTWRSPLLGGSIDARLVPVSPSVDPEEEP